jgi:peptide/nickel transport system ATP-binding protein
VLFRDPVHPYTQSLIAAIPAPDPHHRLDFARLIEGRASNPSAWPEPFRRMPGEPVPLIEVSPGHHVAASAMPIRPAFRMAEVGADG